MGTCNLYEKGYNAGYKMGVKSGLQGSKAKTVMTRDLIYAYGTMAICLRKNHHWKQESVEKLIAEIQRVWCEIDADGNSDETMAELVERTTGIQLVQVVDEIVNLE